MLKLPDEKRKDVLKLNTSSGFIEEVGEQGTQLKSFSNNIGVHSLEMPTVKPMADEILKPVLQS